MRSLRTRVGFVMKTLGSLKLGLTGSTNERHLIGNHLGHLTRLTYAHEIVIAQRSVFFFCGVVGERF